jgi:hypothetical protein
VPVFKYLASRDVDEVGFTVRTASLMSDPEVAFDETNPANYAAFGIRYLLLPSGMTPPVPATRLTVLGMYALWTLPNVSYVQVVDTRGTVSAASGNLGDFAKTFFQSLPVVAPIYPTVAYGGAQAAPGTLPAHAHPTTPAGHVVAEHADLANGTVTVRVDAARRSVVLLSASYDPGWQATVDGRRVPTEMVAPALVGVPVRAGEHEVIFVYKGYPDYPQLAVVAAVTLLGLIAVESRRRLPRSSRSRRGRVRATGFPGFRARPLCGRPQ